MTFYTASFETVTLRFVLMMAIIIGSFTAGFPILGIFALPVFLLAMMGASFSNPAKKTKATMTVSRSEGSQLKQQAA